MELKDKYAAILDIFETTENETFPEAVWRVVCSEKSAQYYDKYCDLLPLENDELRGCWQFWHADREGKKQDYTSDALADVVAALVEPKEGDIIYDCCAGSGSLSIGVWRRCKDVSFVCEELDENVVALLLFNLAVRNIPAVVRVCNTLTRECSAQYEVIKSGKYGIVQKALFPDNKISATKAISNPPFNLKADGVPLNYEFVKHCLSNAESGVFILPQGVLTSSNAEGKQREELIKAGLLKAAISMPSGFFESTGVCVSVLVCNKRKAEGVMLIDAETLTGVEEREQRGEGDACHRNRIYKKKVRAITPAQIESLCQLVTTPTEISTFVPLERLESEGYTLCRGRYMTIEPDAECVMHRSYNDIVREINAIGEARNSLKITINKVWAKELGLGGLIELEKQNKAVVDAINQSLAMVGIEEKIITPDYIAETNSKELVIRQTSKEALSPVMFSFVPLLTQHIRTMNLFENNLLMELRDALLPALMSGRLKIMNDGTDR